MRFDSTHRFGSRDDLVQGVERDEGLLEVVAVVGGEQAEQSAVFGDVDCRLVQQLAPALDHVHLAVIDDGRVVHVPVLQSERRPLLRPSVVACEKKNSFD